MTKIKTSMVRPCLETMYEHRKELAPCFIGAPGIGKTQGIYKFAEEKGINVVTFILSNTVPSEVSGIRMPDKDTKKLEVFDDARMASLKDGDILFFDEILEAPPMLWSACLTLIQDRILASGRKLPDVFIVAASNEVASPAIIPASVRNRFMFLEVQFDAEDWCEWFHEKYGVNPHKISTRIKEDSDQYNILTPRTVEKLYLWLKDGKNIQTKKELITTMFDSVVAKYLLDMVSHNWSMQSRIQRAIGDSNINADVSAISDMSLKETMEYLQSLPEWEEISFVLANTEFEELNKEEVKL
jgi:hypothetical protein